MVTDPEDFGPLTPQQMKELGEHPHWGEDIYDTEQDVVWMNNILNNTPATDPAYKRFDLQRAQAVRYLDLLRRFHTYGVSQVVELNTLH